jgi:hypothetical protein
MIFEIVYWLSTTIVIVGFLFSIRMYKTLGLSPILAMALFLVTALYWHEFDDEISDLLYDVCFVVATAFIITVRFNKSKICYFGDCKSRFGDRRKRWR